MQVRNFELKKEEKKKFRLEYITTRHMYEVGTTQGGPQLHLWCLSLWPLPLSWLQSLMLLLLPIQVIVAVGVITTVATHCCHYCSGCSHCCCHQHGHHCSWCGGGGDGG